MGLIVPLASYLATKIVFLRILIPTKVKVSLHNFSQAFAL